MSHLDKDPAPQADERQKFFSSVCAKVHLKDIGTHDPDPKKDNPVLTNCGRLITPMRVSLLNASAWASWKPPWVPIWDICNECLKIHSKAFLYKTYRLEMR